MKKFIFAGLLTVSLAAPAYAETSSFARLMDQGKSMECTFTKSDGTQDGTIYVAGGRMRGDINMQEDGTAVTMHMIHDSGKMYTWGGPMGENQGMVLSTAGAGAGPMGQQAADMQEEMDFSCKPWREDSSKLTPPSNVQFQDMAQLMSGYAAEANQ